MPWADNPRVPIDTTTGIMHNYGYDRLLTPVRPFKASMVFVDWTRGRSAMTIWVRDMGTGIQYPLFFKDFETVIREHQLDKGVTPELVWDFVKRGANYGIKVADDQEQRV